MLGEKRIVELVKAGEGENELLAPKSFTSFNPFLWQWLVTSQCYMSSINIFMPLSIFFLPVSMINISHRDNFFL